MVAPHGETVNATNYRARVFRPAVELAGITTRCVPHTLRHSMLSAIAAKAIPPTTVMAIAGHQDYRTTAEIYIGTPTASLVDAGKVMGELLK